MKAAGLRHQAGQLPRPAPLTATRDLIINGDPLILVYAELDEVLAIVSILLGARDYSWGGKATGRGRQMSCGAQVIRFPGISCAIADVWSGRSEPDRPGPRQTARQAAIAASSSAS